MPHRKGIEHSARTNTCLLHVSCMHVELPVLLSGKLFFLSFLFLGSMQLAGYVAVWCLFGVCVCVCGTWDVGLWLTGFLFYIDLLLSFSRPLHLQRVQFPSFLLTTYLRQWLSFFPFFFLHLFSSTKGVGVHSNQTYPILSDYPIRHPPRKAI